MRPLEFLDADERFTHGHYSGQLLSDVATADLEYLHGLLAYELVEHELVAISNAINSAIKEHAQ